MQLLPKSLFDIAYSSLCLSYVCLFFFYISYISLSSLSHFLRRLSWSDYSSSFVFSSFSILFSNSFFASSNSFYRCSSFCQHTSISLKLKYYPYFRMICNENILDSFDFLQGVSLTFFHGSSDAIVFIFFLLKSKVDLPFQVFVFADIADALEVLLFVLVVSVVWDVQAACVIVLVCCRCIGVSGNRRRRGDSHRACVRLNCCACCSSWFGRVFTTFLRMLLADKETTKITWQKKRSKNKNINSIHKCSNEAHYQ